MGDKWFNVRGADETDGDRWPYRVTVLAASAYDALTIGGERFPKHVSRREATEVQWGPWRIASNGNGARPWFVMREQLDGRDDSQYWTSSKGHAVRYTRDGAQRQADLLNVAGL